MKHAYAIDPEWTTATLIPSFGWADEEESIAMWQGYAWQARIIVLVEISGAEFVHEFWSSIHMDWDLLPAPDSPEELRECISLIAVTGVREGTAANLRAARPKLP